MPAGSIYAGLAIALPVAMQAIASHHTTKTSLSSRRVGALVLVHRGRRHLWFGLGPEKSRDSFQGLERQH